MPAADLRGAPKRLDLERALRLMAGDPGARAAPSVLRRLRKAFQASGVAGLEALYPPRRTDPLLMGFFAQQVREWMELERSNLGPSKVTWRGNRIEIDCDGARYQLRFAPDRCRWLLLRHARSGWTPVVPGTARLSVVDWLGELRKHRSSLLQEQLAGNRKPPNQGQASRDC